MLHFSMISIFFLTRKSVASRFTIGPFDLKQAISENKVGNKIKFPNRLKKDLDSVTNLTQIIEMIPFPRKETKKKRKFTG